MSKHLLPKIYKSKCIIGFSDQNEICINQNEIYTNKNEIYTDQNEICTNQNEILFLEFE